MLKVRTIYFNVAFTKYGNEGERDRMIKRYGQSEVPASPPENSESQQGQARAYDIPASAPPAPVRTASSVGVPLIQAKQDTAQSGQARAYATPEPQPSTPPQQARADRPTLGLFASFTPLGLFQTWSKTVANAQSTGNVLLKWNLDVTSEVLRSNYQIVWTFLQIPRQLTENNVQLWENYIKSVHRSR